MKDTVFVDEHVLRPIGSIDPFEGAREFAARLKKQFAIAVCTPGDRKTAALWLGRHRIPFDRIAKPDERKDCKHVVCMGSTARPGEIQCFPLMRCMGYEAVAQSVRYRVE